LLSVLLAREARSLVLLLVVLSCTASDEDIDARSLVVETRIKLAFRQLTNKIVDLSTLIALQGNGLDLAEFDALSRVFDVERKHLFCIALEHREKTLRRIEADGHEGGTVRVVDSGELFLQSTRLDADTKLIKILGGQKDDGRCSGRHVCGELKLLDKSKYNLCNDCSRCEIGVRKRGIRRLVTMLAEERKERGLSSENSLIIDLPSEMPGLPEEGESPQNWTWDPDESTENQAQGEDDQTFNSEV
jgi:hypothetical protein